MITSEVQRTLVKSPPELWAELSDPTSLARHLGELGEIRITRVDPEKRVEWETTGASGSVAIKPSGWGTRVTLTVQHEEGGGEQAGRSTPETASEASPIEAADAAEDSGPSPIEAAGAAGDSGPSPIAPQASAEAAGVRDASAETGAEPGPEPEPEPAPAHITAREPVTALASWAAAFGAERSGSTKPAPKARIESAIVPVARGEQERDPHQAPGEPRPGLFARLFGRLRKPAGAETSQPAVARAPAPEAIPPGVAVSTRGASASEKAPVLEHLDEAPSPKAVEVAPVAATPAPPGDPGTPRADDTLSGGEGHQAKAPEAKAGAETSAVDTNADANARPNAGRNVDAETATTVAHADADADSETSTAVTDESAPVETSNPDAPAAEATSEEQQPDESAADAEHAAERGAEEVTAVLTAVLDRLGAAHHRPFSRG
jgi:hypothetical protein